MSIEVSTGGIQSITIDRNTVCRRLGYRGHTPLMSILPLVDSQIARAHKLIKPVYTYKLKAIEDIHEEQVFMAGSLVLTSKIVSYVLSDCRWAAVFLVTIGSDLGEEMSKLMKKGDILEALILDAIGSEAVEQACFKVQGAVKERAGVNGCQATAAYSPGYCDWDVSQQKVLFQALDSTSLGVSLTESCMMVPEKSVSGIIGIGKFDKTKPPPCLVVCSKRASCTYKRVDWDPEKQWLL